MRCQSVCVSVSLAIQFRNEHPAQLPEQIGSAIWCAMGVVWGISSIQIPSNGYINHMMTIPKHPEIASWCHGSNLQWRGARPKESAEQQRELASSSFKQATLAGWCSTTWLRQPPGHFTTCLWKPKDAKSIQLRTNEIWTYTQHKPGTQDLWYMLLFWYSNMIGYANV